MRQILAHREILTQYCTVPDFILLHTVDSSVLETSQLMINPEEGQFGSRKEGIESVNN